MRNQTHHVASPASGLDWRQVVGLQDAMTDLSIVLTGERMHPVLLLEGIEGIGKRHLAYWVAAMQLCSQRQLNRACSESPDSALLVVEKCSFTSSKLRFFNSSRLDSENSEQALSRVLDGVLNMPCGKCADCVEVLSGTHNDLFVIEAEEDSIKTSDIEMMQNHLDILSPKGKRVALILNAEKMTREAANRALKTLEEPSSQSRIVLTSSRPLMMPKTILGRCLRWKIKPLKKDEVLQWFQSLVEKSNSSIQGTEHLESLAHRWGYSPGQIYRHALQNGDLVSNKVDQDIKILLQAQNPMEVLQRSSDLAKVHKIKVPEMLRAMEWSISESLRTQLLSAGAKSSMNTSTAMYRRRKLLRDVRSKAVFGKIVLNTQLVAESIGFCNWDEGDS